MGEQSFSEYILQTDDSQNKERFTDYTENLKDSKWNETRINNV